MVALGVCRLRGCCLVYPDGTKCAQELVVDSLCIVEEASNNSLHPLDAGRVKWWAGILVVVGESGLGALGDGAMLVW